MTSIPVLLALLLTATSYVDAQDACSAHFNAACLAEVRSLYTNTSAFWFGTRYATDCPPDKVSSLCRNTERSEKTLFTRILGKDATHSNGLSFIVNVKYPITVPADGSDRKYNGCGRIVDAPLKRPQHFVIDPLGKTVYPPYDLREEPEVTWPADKNALYAVIMYDPAPFYMHAFYVNVPGGTLKNGDTIFPHNGPGNPVDRVNPYVWLVFKQQKSVDGSKIARNRRGVHIQDLVSQLGLSTQSYGMNIVMTSTDEFTAVFIRSVNFLNRCPVYYGQWLNSYIRSKGGLPSFPGHFDLSVSVDVTFKAPAITYTACGKTYHKSQVDVTVDYRFMGQLGSLQTRLSPQVSLVPLDMSNPPSVELKNKQYTLVMLDLTDELGKTKQDAYVHWMVVNIRGTDITSGDEVFEWKLPIASTSNNLYLFALFEQTKHVSTASARVFTAAYCSRCKYRAGDFIHENNLSLVGLRRLRFTPDTYQQYMSYRSGTETMTQACKRTIPVIG